MAGLSLITREQLGAIVVLRWRLFVNSLRSVRGRVNLVSRAIAALVVVGAGVGGAVGIGAAAWGLTNENKLAWLALPCWLISIFWQLFPVMATAFTQNVDTSALLRFPLSYRSYFLVRMIYGSLDIATALGFCWSLGLSIGVGTAKPELIGWALLAVGGLIVFNILLSRATFAWIEHWLSLRRSREVITVFVLLLMLCFQLAGPMLGRFSRHSNQWRFHAVAKLVPVERVLPPGLAANTIMYAGSGNVSTAGFALGMLGGYAALAAMLLHARLRNQYRGEVISSGEARPSDLPPSAAENRHGWRIPLLSGAMSAVVEKELRYFSRSGPMLFTLIMPVIVLILLWGGRNSFLGHRSALLFPIGAAYCLLVMNNILYNSFGGDGGGIQFFLISPVPFRKIVAAKNVAQIVVLVVELFVLWAGVSLIYQKPTLGSIMLTIAWYLMAAPLNFIAGNLLSVYSPKRIDHSTFGRQRASETAILVSLAVQLLGVGLGAGAIFIGLHYSKIWISIAILLALALPSMAGYLILLTKIDGIAIKRREVLATELCRVQVQ